MQEERMKKQGPKPMGKKEYKDSKHVVELGIFDEYNKIHTSLLKNLNKP